MGNYSSDKLTVYRNVRLTKDPKHFPAKGNPGEQGYQPAATYLTFVDQTKDGVDIFIDAKVQRGAELMSNLKKGDICDVTAPRGVEWHKNPKGDVVGKIFDASVATTVKLRDRATATEPLPALPEIPTDDGSAPAFD